VVARELRDLAVADPVRAAVADVSDVRDLLLGADQQAHHRGAHALQRVVAQRALVNLLVGQLDRRGQPVLRQRQVRVDRERPGRVFFFGRLEEATHGIGRHHAGDFAALMTAHSVRNEVQTEIVDTTVRIFVVVSLKTNVTQTCGFDAHTARPRDRWDARGRKGHAL
jgi:hypothetical protein